MVIMTKEEKQKRQRDYMRNYYRNNPEQRKKVIAREIQDDLINN